jgi:hypothetical protein
LYRPANRLHALILPPDFAIAAAVTPTVTALYQATARSLGASARFQELIRIGSTAIRQ